MDEKLNLALIAHDNKKAEMVAFAFANKDLLRYYEIYATGTTGKLIKREDRTCGQSNVVWSVRRGPTDRGEGRLG